MPPTPSTSATRGLSPVRSPLAATKRIPSPLPSPVMRPSSPLSPGVNPSHLQVPSPRAAHTRATGNSTRRVDTRSLKLPSLPRFHPANFPSAQDRHAAQPPISPRSHSRLYSDAQKQLLMFHHESVAAASRSASLEGRPLGPKLAPMGSPEPVMTPLELEMGGGGEERDGYLFAGVRENGGSRRSVDEAVERMIREERERSERAEGEGRQ